jgi:hypothetical protein
MPSLPKHTAFGARDHYTHVRQLFATGCLRRLNALEEMLDREIRAANVHGVCTVPQLCGHLPYGIAVRLICDPGIGAEDIDRAVVVFDCIGERSSYRILIANIALDAVEIRVVTRRQSIRAEIMCCDLAALC